jgi:hypothetical protein
LRFPTAGYSSCVSIVVEAAMTGHTPDSTTARFIATTGHLS